VGSRPSAIIVGATCHDVAGEPAVMGMTDIRQASGPRPSGFVASTASAVDDAIEWIRGHAGRRLTHVQRRLRRLSGEQELDDESRAYYREMMGFGTHALSPSMKAAIDDARQSASV
jgi:hypothetical protein